MALKTVVDAVDSQVVDAGDDIVVSHLDNMTILGDTTFANNDILRIKDGVSDEWFEVEDASGAPTYEIWRDKASAYDANTCPAWKKGTSTVNFGGVGEGGIYLTSSESNSPYISVVSHQGSPWTTLTSHLRLGNLNGFLGYTSDLYGIAIGETANYLKYDITNGLQVRGNITTSSLTACTISASAINTSTLSSVTINASVITATSSYTGVSIGVNYTDAKATDPNADETGANTSLNTSSVSNVAASYVSGWAHPSNVTQIDGGDMYVGSTIVLGSSGYMRSGQTNYNVGTGWWIGDVAGTPKFSIGNSSTNETLTWNGSVLAIGGNNVNGLIFATSAIINYYVDCDNGSDITGTGSSGTPFATVQHAVDLIPKVVNHAVSINLMSSTNYSETVDIDGFIGYGSFTIASADSDRTTVLWRPTNSSTSKIIQLENCILEFYIRDLSFLTLGTSQKCIWLAESPFPVIYNCAVGATATYTSNTVGIYADTSRVYLFNIYDYGATKVATGMSATEGSYIGYGSNAVFGTANKAASSGSMVTDAIVDPT